MATLTINGQPLPSPYKDVEFIIETMVNSGRNANGTVVGEVVGRDNYKVNNLEWRGLDASEVSRILTLLQNFYITAKIPDPVTNGWKTIAMYPGNRTAKPLTGWVDDEGKPTRYEYLKVNIIDCGVI
jgi:hypothetical protein